MERRDDNDLLEALGEAIEAAQPMPASVLSLGRAAWDARALDAEFAELVGDSLLDEDRAGDRLAIRGTTQPRLLSFAAGDTAIEIEVELQADGSRRLLGQLVPPGPATVSFEREAITEDVPADEGGRFELGDVTPGPARLRVQRASDSPLATAWFRL